eukprot:gene9807-biopygen5936
MSEDDDFESGIAQIVKDDSLCGQAMPRAGRRVPRPSAGGQRTLCRAAPRVERQQAPQQVERAVRVPRREVRGFVAGVPRGPRPLVRREALRRVVRSADVRLRADGPEVGVVGLGGGAEEIEDQVELLLEVLPRPEHLVPLGEQLGEDASKAPHVDWFPVLDRRPAPHQQLRGAVRKGMSGEQ